MGSRYTSVAGYIGKIVILPSRDQARRRRSASHSPCKQAIHLAIVALAGDDELHDLVVVRIDDPVFAGVDRQRPS